LHIAVFGLGYIGLVCATCFAHNGHTVVGVDVDTSKIDMVNSGQAPIVEPGLQNKLSEVVAAKKLSATSDVLEVMTGAEAIFICVGTPSGYDGFPDLSYIYNVARQIGSNLSAASDYPVVVIRSTVPPGTLILCKDILEQTSGRKAGEDFGVVLNPEFLREGSALADFMDPSYTLVGTTDSKAANVMKELYSFIDAPYRIELETATEVVKYVTNYWHATKIAFANEIGAFCKHLGIDSYPVMDLLCSDPKLNISTAYLKPGFAYGGSCLPKDLLALKKIADPNGVDLPLLKTISISNQAHLNRCIRLIQKVGKKRVGFLGLSFKAKTDDLRDSPAVQVVKSLLSSGLSIMIYDPNINITRLVGSNLAYIDQHINHLSDLLVDTVEELANFAETIVVTNDDECYMDVARYINDQHIVIDFARTHLSEIVSEERYHGICW
jgi:GDP-mannose 6-dehydrogenase